MTRVKINPGVCGFIAEVTAVSQDDGESVKLTVSSQCQAVGKLLEAGDTFDPFELCLKRPGENPLYKIAGGYFPAHAACPVIAGIIKCAEAECHLALPRDASMVFEECNPEN